MLNIKDAKYKGFTVDVNMHKSTRRLYNMNTYLCTLHNHVSRLTLIRKLIFQISKYHVSRLQEVRCMGWLNHYCNIVLNGTLGHSVIYVALMPIHYQEHWVVCCCLTVWEEDFLKPLLVYFRVYISSSAASIQPRTWHLVDISRG